MLTIPPIQLLPLLYSDQLIRSSASIFIHLHHRLSILESPNPGKYLDPEVIVKPAGHDTNPL